MKKIIIVLAAALCVGSVSAQEVGNKAELQWYGFIRNYTSMDTRTSKAGTGDLFYWLPLDENKNPDGVDLNQNFTWRSLAMTSRLGVNVKGLYYGDYKFGAKIETDFYNLNGVTAVLRMRQAYLTIDKDNTSIKMGQAWHPMSGDLVDVFALNTGAPFSPFSRTPQLTVDQKHENWTFTASALYQMQYCSTGPSGTSANYIKNGGFEFFEGVTYKKGGLTLKAGINELCIKPISSVGNQKVDGKLFTNSLFAYAKWAKDDFQINGRVVLHEAGEHVGLMGGYALVSTEDGKYKYTPTMGLTANINTTYKLNKNLKAILYLGYYKNLGLEDEISFTNYTSNYWFNGNGSKTLAGAARVTPALLWSFGKLDLGIEYEMTAAGYGTIDSSLEALAKGVTDGRPTEDLHTVCNHRVQTILKLNF